MGWAKYHEDIVSRWVSDNNRRLPCPIATQPPIRGDDTKRSAAASPEPEEQMSELREFTMPSARPLPVIVLADVSGSMSANGKIEALNDAVAEMIAIFADEDSTRAEIHVSVIAFGGGGAKLHTSLEPAYKTQWEPIKASGRTPMGGAFALAQEMLEDREKISSRSYRPTLILVSDGMPTDEWRGPLSRLHQSERASKAMRFAMGIGADADHGTLTAFLGNDEARVFAAHEAREIKNFFRWVTMTVTTRSRSANPNSSVMIEPTDLDDFDF